VRRVALTVVLVCAACAPERARDRAANASPPIDLTDDAGNAVRLERPARRVVSLVPSATESLVALGAAGQIVGRTRYDTSAEVAALPSVGGGIDASVEAIVNLHPDLVIAWNSDSRGATRERLVSLGIPVFVIKTEDTTDIFRGIASLGRMTGHDSAATAIATSVRRELVAVQRAAAGRPAPTVFYVVYNDPPMTAGPRTFIGQLISLAGGRSIFTDSSQLWPNVAMEEIVRRDPDLVIVPAGDSSAKPLERFRQLTGWRALRAVREGHVVTVPADLVNRPSPVIGRSARVLLDAIHPELRSDTSQRVRSEAPR
jgi:iron complex transport system substrate-binding protein